MTVPDRIVAKALELYNEKGIEYVGMRELAAALDTKLGNITYYFPTKEDLILRISSDLSELNSSVYKPDANISITTYFDIFRRHFEHQFQYRCLFLSFVHLMFQYERLSVRYKKVEEIRKKTGIEIIEHLITNGYLKSLTSEDKAYLSSATLLISRFWISEAAISHKGKKPADQIEHYLRLLAQIMLPYCTTKGKTQISDVIIHE